ncbi:unnamed protein product [Ambrosiozyma monospora]|uniref:Unnamed protein product n=1 Tax=Ambrosiozyma monospora TaxID=43982 RepID=A0ACB5U2B9_AMBMO|nr:unnamed protein product [Ambrosiozyma monospora]
MEIPLLIVCPNGDNKLFRQFSRNGFSTGLGLFEVKEFSMKLIQDFNIKCRSHTISDTVKTELLSFCFPNKKPTFDLMNAEYYPEQKQYCISTSLGELFEHDTPLISHFQKPVPGSIKLGTRFTNKNTLSLNIVIGNTQQDDQQAKKFKFHVGVTLKCKIPDELLSGGQDLYNTPTVVPYKMVDDEDDESNDDQDVTEVLPPYTE